MSSTYTSGPYEGDVCLYLTDAETDGFMVEQMRKADPLFGWSGLVKGQLKVERLASSHLGMVAGKSGEILAEVMEHNIKTALQME